MISKCEILSANVQIKPNSDITPLIAIEVFKGFLSRVYKISIEKYLQSGIDFLIDIFTENGHKRSTLRYLHSTYKTSINQSATIRTTPRTLKTKLPWVPILGPKLQKEFRKKNMKTVFTSGANLKSILYQNKSKLLPSS